ncbi:MAG: LysE family translocator [Nocardioidaceae bacterium]
MSVEFLVTALVVVAIPGAGVLYTLAAALSRGARARVVAAAGCTLGIVPHLLAAITGLAALLYASAVAFQVVKYVGVTYLLYMAWAMWKEKGALSVEEKPAPRSSARVVLSGILVNVLNPKLALFFVAYGLFSAVVRNHVLARPRVVTWMRRTFAGDFVALCARLALSDPCNSISLAYANPVSVFDGAKIDGYLAVRYVR